MTNQELIMSRTFKRVLSSIVLFCSVFFFASTVKAESVYAPKVTMVVDGYTYTCLTNLAAVSDHRVSANTTVGTSVARPAGYIGSRVYICRGNRVIGSDIRYSTTSIASVISSSTVTSTPGTVCDAFGEMNVYQPSTGEYKTKQTVYTPRVVVYSAPSEFDETESGKTYGTLLQAYELGEKPDYVEAEATNGEIGYVRSSDLFPDNPESPEAAIQQYSTERVSEIPVYDSDGVVVGHIIATSGTSGK